jgi:nucleoside-diphosphate-sugar epimerase
MKVLVTGAAGFIGSNLVERLLTTESPIEIVGLDSVNDYYDVSIKEYRLSKLEKLAAEHPESKWES